METRPKRGKIKAFGVVIDKNGKIKCDDPYSLPPEILDELTEQEKEELFHGTNTCNDRKEYTG